MSHSRPPLTCHVKSDDDEMSKPPMSPSKKRNSGLLIGHRKKRPMIGSAHVCESERSRSANGRSAEMVDFSDMTRPPIYGSSDTGGCGITLYPSPKSTVYVLFTSCASLTSAANAPRGSAPEELLVYILLAKNNHPLF